MLVAKLSYTGRSVTKTLRTILEIITKLFSLGAAGLAGWAIYKAYAQYGNPTFPQLTYQAGGVDLAFPTQALVNMGGALGLYAFARTLGWALGHLLVTDRIFVLSQQGATWKLKSFMQQGMEKEAIRFAREHYQISSSEAKRIIEQLRMGISPELDDYTEEDSNTSSPPDFFSDKLTTPPKFEAPTKIKVDHHVAEKARELVRLGKEVQAIELLKVTQDMDDETAKKVVNKLREMD